MNDRAATATITAAMTRNWEFSEEFKVPLISDKSCWKCFPFQPSNPRDVVHANKTLYKAVGNDGISVNYTMPAEDVYYQTVFLILNADKSFAIHTLPCPGVAFVSLGYW